MSEQSTKIKSVAFIGLGTMGYPMAGHLAAKGFNVTVFNRTAAKAERYFVASATTTTFAR